MMGHNICFCRELWLIIPKLSLLPFLIWSTEGSVLHISPCCLSTVSVIPGVLVSSGLAREELTAFVFQNLKKFSNHESCLPGA